MKQTKSILPAVALLVMLPFGAGAKTSFQGANEYMIRDHVQPGYARFAKSSAVLVAATEDYCAAPGSLAKEALSAFHLDAMLDWQKVQLVRFGPIEDQDRAYRLQFWPDKRNKTGKALKKLQGQVRDGREIDAASISRGSVATQGFPAFERLMLQQEITASDCRILRAVSGNIAGIASQLSSEWQDAEEEAYSYQILNADTGTDLFKTPKDASFEIFKTFQTGLQVLAENKLARPLGKSLAKAKPKRAESWRTGQSALYFRENATMLAWFYGISDPMILDGDRQSYSAMLADIEGGDDLDRRIRESFRRLFITLDGMRLSFADAVKNESARAEMEKAYTILTELRKMVDGEMSELLDFSIGFNSLDGD